MANGPNFREGSRALKLLLAFPYNCSVLLRDTAHVSDDERRLLRQLPFSQEATFDHHDQQAEPLCLENTRTEILASIMTWACAPLHSGSRRGDGHVDGSQRVYWLNGMAGTGKTTIARTVARRCADAGRLGASYFFARGGGERETARNLVSSIAVQLAARGPPALRQHICHAVCAHDGIANKSLLDQWRRLVLRPLEKTVGASSAAEGTEAEAEVEADATALNVFPLVVVIDALDECGDESEIALVLQLLSEQWGGAASQLRIFMTSRPEAVIRHHISDLPANEWRHIILHRLNPPVVDHDISLFFEDRLGVVKRERQLPPEWPGSANIQRLVQKAGGASTAFSITWRTEPAAGQKKGLMRSISACCETRLRTTSPTKKLMWFATCCELF